VVAKPLLIVAPKALEPALAEYVKFKKTQLSTRLVPLETILSSTAGADDPEKLKRYVYDYRKAHHLGYLLLVGDRDAMPIRYMTNLKFSTFDYLFLPTDLYYSDLEKEDGSFDDWNGNKSSYHNGYFGELTGTKGQPINLDDIHFRPQIAVGRWPVSTPEAVRIIADKSMAYEKSIVDGTHPGMRTAAVFHPQGWVDARDELSRLGHSLPTGWKMAEFFYQDENTKYKTQIPSEELVIKELNRGLGLCVHVGHGEPDCWLGYPAVTNDKINSVLNTWQSFKTLKNAGKVPVVISIGCSTAYFAPLGPNEPYIDVNGKEHAGEAKKEVFKGPPPAPSPYQKGKLPKDSLGKQMLEDGPNGAVAYIGSDMVAQPMALTLLDGFITSMRSSHQPRVGDCWSFSINWYYQKMDLAHLKTEGDWVAPATFGQPMKFNLFGDPSLPMAPNPAPTRTNAKAQ
jgi:hypothetical protein